MCQSHNPWLITQNYFKYKYTKNPVFFFRNWDPQRIFSFSLYEKFNILHLPYHFYLFSFNVLLVLTPTLLQCSTIISEIYDKQYKHTYLHFVFLVCFFVLLLDAKIDRANLFEMTKDEWCGREIWFAGFLLY